ASEEGGRGNGREARAKRGWRSRGQRGNSASKPRLKPPAKKTGRKHGQKISAYNTPSSPSSFFHRAPSREKRSTPKEKTPQNIKKKDWRRRGAQIYRAPADMRLSRLYIRQ